MSWAVVAIAVGSMFSAYMGNQSANRAADAQTDASNRSIGEQRRQFDLIRSDTQPYRDVGQSALNQLAAIYGLQPSQAQRDAEIQRLQAQLDATPERVQTGFRDVVTGVDGQRNDIVQQQAIWQDNTAARNELQARIDALSNTTVGTNTTPAFDITQSPGYNFRLEQGQRAIDRAGAARGRSLSGAGVRAGIRYASGLAADEFGNYTNRLAALAGIGQTSVGQSSAAAQNAANQNSNALLAAGNARANAYLTGGQATNNAVQGGISNALLYNYLNNGQGNQQGNFNPARYGGG